MRLSPQDIHHKEFKRVMRGYSDVEVDLFLDEVYEEFERLYKENHELKDEAEKLRNRVERYEKLEKTLNETMITAQRSAEEIREKARLEAESLVNDANEKVKLAVTGASAEAARLEGNLSELIETEKTFRSELKKFVLGFATRIDEVSSRVEPDIVTGIDTVADNESFPGIEAEEAEEDNDADDIAVIAADLDIKPEVVAVGSSDSQTYTSGSDEPAVEDVEIEHSLMTSTPTNTASETSASSPSESDQSSSSSADSFFKAMTEENEKFAVANTPGSSDRSSYQIGASTEKVDPGPIDDSEKTQEFDQAMLHDSEEYSKSRDNSDVGPGSSVSNDQTGSFSINSGTSSFWGKRTEEEQVDQEVNIEETFDVKDSGITEPDNSTSSAEADGILRSEPTPAFASNSSSTPGGIYLSDNIHNFISGEKIVHSDEEVEEPKKDESTSSSMFGSYRKDDN